jgi:hypothetical protein
MLFMQTTLTHELVKARQTELALVQTHHELPAVPRRRLRLAIASRGHRRSRLAAA